MHELPVREYTELLHILSAGQDLLSAGLGLSTCHAATRTLCLNPSRREESIHCQGPCQQATVSD